jgi:flagellar assembly factor FliW
MQVLPYSRLVSLPIHAENIFHFPEGLPAFESVKDFVFVHKPDLSPFLFMHALEPSDLSFVCVDPFLVNARYRPTISDADVSALHVQSPADLLLLSIVTVARDVRNTTANLQGPVAINIQACLGKQVICENQHYPVRYRIWDAMEAINARKESRESGETDEAVMGVPLEAMAK